MYHPNKYDEHNEALIKVIDKFNETANKLGGLVEMYFQKKENFRDDGGVIYKPTNEKFLYDFEKRHTYYDTCSKLKFPTLGQFERKIKKQEIKLSIQCSTDETCLVIAWHEDYHKEETEYINSETEDGRGEMNGKRFTKDFIEISYSNMETLYNIFLSAFEESEFNKKSFKLISSPKGKYTNTPIYEIECKDLIELAVNNNSKYKIIAKKELSRRFCK